MKKSGDITWARKAGGDMLSTGELYGIKWEAFVFSAGPRRWNAEIQYSENYGGRVDSLIVYHKKTKEAALQEASDIIASLWGGA